MKVFYQCILLISICQVVYGQVGEWIWMKGPTITNDAGNWGIQGVPAATNNPPALYEACQWTDNQGDFWLYGGLNTSSGFSVYAALWRYQVATHMWTWVQGPSATSGTFPVYGMQGIPDVNNNPGSRFFGSASWVDTLGNLWLFGGVSLASGNDLWKYDISTNEWTWMKGPQAAYDAGSYGTQGVPNITNNPRARCETVCTWTDSENRLWLYGGQDLTFSGSSLNDLLRYDIATNIWTWISGSSVPDQPAVYGTMGVPAPTNAPGARRSYARWIDSEDNLFLFGGLFDDPGGNFLTLNDLWKYDMNSSDWTWLSGSANFADGGMYGSQCIFSTNYFPSGRLETRSCWQDNSGHFYLYGGLETGYVVNGDLWVYDLSSNTWAWIGGDIATQTFPVYTTIGVSSPLNKPGGRWGALSWMDQQGNLWMYGGYDAAIEFKSDLWRFKVDSGCLVFHQTNLSVSDTSVCEKFCVDFSDLSANNPTAWQWIFQGGTPATSSLQNPVNICYNNPGTYDVTLITTNANGTDTITLINYITVHPSPSIPVITQTGYTLTSSSAANYQWQFNNVDIPGATNQMYEVTQTGYYTVLITDQNGCSSSATQYVLITGMDEVFADANVMVYPNPSNGNFIVELSNCLIYDHVTIEVVNMLGQVVYSSENKIQSSTFKNEIHLCRDAKHCVSTGIYFIEIRSGNLFGRQKIMVGR